MTPYTDKDAERADKPRFKQFTLHAYSERYSPGIKHDGPNRRVYDADEVDAALADHERLREAATRADELKVETVWEATPQPTGNGDYYEPCHYELTGGVAHPGEILVPKARLTAAEAERDEALKRAEEAEAQIAKAAALVHDGQSYLEVTRDNARLRARYAEVVEAATYVRELLGDLSPNAVSEELWRVIYKAHDRAAIALDALPTQPTRDPLTCPKCGGPTKENGRWAPDLGAVYGYELGRDEARAEQTPQGSKGESE